MSSDLGIVAFSVVVTAVVFSPLLIYFIVARRRKFFRSRVAISLGHESNWKIIDDIQERIVELRYRDVDFYQEYYRKQRIDGSHQWTIFEGIPVPGYGASVKVPDDINNALEARYRRMAGLSGPVLASW